MRLRFYLPGPDIMVLADVIQGRYCHFLACDHGVEDIQIQPNETAKAAIERAYPFADFIAEVHYA